MSALPSSPPPGGDVNRGPTFLAVAGTSTAVAFLTLVLRLYVRIAVVHNVGWDDYCIVFAMVLGLIGLGLNVAQVHYGMGRHVYYLEQDPAELVNAIKFTQISQPFLIMATAATKISICFFLLRIVEKIRAYRIFLYVMIFFAFAVNLSASLLIVLQCQPVDKLWDPLLPGRCLAPSVNQGVAYMQGGFTIFTDWLLAAFPILVLKQLHMATKTKYALAVIMGLGVFVGGAALARTVELSVLDNRSDVTFDFVDLACWALMEQNVGIIAVNVPPLRALFTKVFRMGSSGNSYGRENAYGSELKNISGAGRQRKGAQTSSSLSAARTGLDPRERSGGRGPKSVGDFDDQSSEQSLVSDLPSMPPLDDKILKTVSVQVRSEEENNYDPSYPDPEAGQERRQGRGHNWTRMA